LHQGSLFEPIAQQHLSDADVIVCNVQIPPEHRKAWLAFLTEHTRVGARIATYLCLEDISGSSSDMRDDKIPREPYDEEYLFSNPTPTPAPGWTRLHRNRTNRDRFFTSWAPINGHHLFIYTRE